MSKIEYLLWGADFVIGGIGYILGGPYAGGVCFLVGGALVLVATMKTDEKDNNHFRAAILMDGNNEPYVRKSKIRLWHKWGLAVFGIGALSLIAYGSYEYETHPRHSRNRLRWGGTDVFSENRYIEAGKNLAFKFYFTPVAGSVTNTHSVMGCVIGEDFTPLGDQRMIARFQNIVKENLEEDKNIKEGTEVPFTMSATKDITCPALSVSQVNGVLGGSARVYVLAWLGWIGEDGIKDETQYCLWLEHPAPLLSAEDAKRWQLCSPSEPTQRLW